MTKANAASSLATWFGCGLMPKAPGTAGSLGALVPAIALSRAITLDGGEIALFGALLFGPAVWASDVTAREMRMKDPQTIVIDEVVGQCITFAGATHLNWKSWAAGFVLFRVFDMTKPFPIRSLEALPGGPSGSSLMTPAAGVYAALVLFLMGWFQSLLAWESAKSSNMNRPEISQITPPAAITGGELQIRGKSFSLGDRPYVTIGDVAAQIVIGSDSLVIVKVPEGASAGELVVKNAQQASQTYTCDIGIMIAENLHPVTNPAVDGARQYLQHL